MKKLISLLLVIILVASFGGITFASGVVAEIGAPSVEAVTISSTDDPVELLVIVPKISSSVNLEYLSFQSTVNFSITVNGKVYLGSFSEGITKFENIGPINENVSVFSNNLPEGSYTISLYDLKFKEGDMGVVPGNEEKSFQISITADFPFDRAVRDGIILGYTALKTPLLRTVDPTAFAKQYGPKDTCTKLQTAAIFQRIFFGKFVKYPTEVLTLAGIDKNEGSLSANLKFINKLLADNNLDFVFATQDENGKEIWDDIMSREEIVVIISDVKNALFSEE